MILGGCHMERRCSRKHQLEKSVVSAGQALYLSLNVEVELLEAAARILKHCLRFWLPFLACVHSRACSAIISHACDEALTMQHTPPGIGEEITVGRVEV